MRAINLGFVFIIISIIISEGNLKIVRLDESWICGIKKSCVDCLQLDHCSWCPTTNKCYSDNSLSLKECNDTLKSANYEMSLYENAECACGVVQMTNNCRPPGITDGPECYGRGTCVCGKCFCNTTPDPENPSKIIMGEHCEFDNFSCDGPKCNEGPYSINDLHIYEERNAAENTLAEIDTPVEND